MNDNRFEFQKIDLPQVWLNFYKGAGGGFRSGGKIKLPPDHALAKKFPDKVATKQEMEERAAKMGGAGDADIDSTVLPAIGKKLGEGANGAVYLTDRGTVLKRSQQGSLKDQEREIAKKMGELGIAPSVYYSDSKNMEMENLVAKGGKSLDNLGRPLNRAEFDDLLSKVDKMHRAGVYHRDLHEGNIFVMPDNQVKIIDFGMGGIEKNKLAADDFMLVADYRAIRHHAEQGGHPVPKKVSSAIEKEKESMGFDIEQFIDLF